MSKLKSKTMKNHIRNLEKAFAENKPVYYNGLFVIALYILTLKNGIVKVRFTNLETDFVHIKELEVTNG